MYEPLNFKIARKEIGISQIDLAKELGITRETIGNTERGNSLNYKYFHYLIDKGYSKEWLEGTSNEKYITQERSNNQLIQLQEEIKHLKDINNKIEQQNSHLKTENKSLRTELREVREKLDRIQEALANKFLGLDLGKRKVSGINNIEILLAHKKANSQATHK